jgi:hypothetical protein
MRSVEPEHGSVPPDCPSGSTIGRIEAEFPHDTAPGGGSNDGGRKLIVGPYGCLLNHASTVTLGTDILANCHSLSGRPDLNRRSPHPQCGALDQAGLRPVARSAPDHPSATRRLTGNCIGRPRCCRKRRRSNRPLAMRTEHGGYVRFLAAFHLTRTPHEAACRLVAA